MLAFAKGHALAFEWVYERNRTWLLHMLRGKLRSWANGVSLAEDVAQDTWLTIVKTSTSYQPTAKFSTWLYTLANQRLIDQCRKARPEQQLPWEQFSEHSDQPDPLEEGQFDSIFSSHHDEVLDTIERKQMGSRLMQAIENLPQEQQEVFMLVAQAGLSVPEAAKSLGWPLEAAKSRLRYARAKLVLALGESAHE